MSKVVVNTQAPDFALTDIQANPVTLSSFRGVSPVYLVLNRGFS